MYPQYLLPQMVLFGQPSSLKVQCPHSYSYKDGELVVHQTISRKLPQIIYKDNNRYSQYDDQYEEYISQVMKRQPPMKLKEFLLQQEQEQESEVPYFNEMSPLGHQMEGVSVRADLIPSQLQKLLEAAPLPRKHYKNVPLTRPVYPPYEPQQQQDDDDSSWTTEEEQQEYLTNQQLQEVSGNILTDPDLQ